MGSTLPCCSSSTDMGQCLLVSSLYNRVSKTALRTQKPIIGHYLGEPAEQVIKRTNFIGEQASEKASVGSTVSWDLCILSGNLGAQQRLYCYSDEISPIIVRGRKWEGKVLPCLLRNPFGLTISS
jgi:hypothetical protein